MTLLQGDRRCGRLLRWGLEKNREGAQPTGFPRPHGVHSCPGSHGVSWDREHESGDPPQPVKVPSHPWEYLQQPLTGGDSPEPISAAKLLGLSRFFLPVPLLDGKAENWGRQFGKKRSHHLCHRKRGISFPAQTRVGMGVLLCQQYCRRAGDRWCAGLWLHSPSALQGSGAQLDLGQGSGGRGGLFSSPASFPEPLQAPSWPALDVKQPWSIS